jgi:hypothetical protein
MEFRQFGRTGLKVSAIGFGCWEIGGTYGHVDEIQFHRAVHAAVDTGITCFDTAEAYGMGVSEEALARALAGRRNGVVIATKFGVGYEEMPNRRDSSRARVLASIDNSLKRLRTDHIDISLLTASSRGESSANFIEPTFIRRRSPPGNSVVFLEGPAKVTRAAQRSHTRCCSVYCHSLGTQSSARRFRHRALAEARPSNRAYRNVPRCSRRSRP